MIVIEHKLSSKEMFIILWTQIKIRLRQLDLKSFWFQIRIRWNSLGVWSRLTGQNREVAALLARKKLWRTSRECIAGPGKSVPGPGKPTLEAFDLLRDELAEQQNNKTKNV